MNRNILKSAKLENWLNFFWGLWVFCIPWTLADGFKSNAVNVVMWNFLVVGGVVMLMSMSAIRRLQPWEEWLSLFAGVWLIFSPWFLVYSDNKILLWNSLFFGVLISGLSGVAIRIAEKPVYHRTIRSHLFFK